MSKFAVAYKKQITIPNQDLVTLGILPKQVSEYTDDDIGSIILIPYTDESGNIEGPIEFEVVGVNHHKNINDESKPTITLMTKYLIRHAAFDGKEPTNPESDIAKYGNSRWAVSNIRQWLNSEGKANEWFTPQHEYDTAPDISTIVNADATEAGSYADEAGFLAGFSDEIKQHFATVRNTTIRYEDFLDPLSQYTEETEDKIFLFSGTEMGLNSNLDKNKLEGNTLSKKFINNASVFKTFKSGELGYYWTRSQNILHASWPYAVCVQSETSIFGSSQHAYTGSCGIAPVIVLC
jgi:bifunctional DNA-binding transcriptional regulator/antitoxin component of YhaV-PrlF toxin-antitoxin module